MHPCLGPRLPVSIPPPPTIVAHPISNGSWLRGCLWRCLIPCTPIPTTTYAHFTRTNIYTRAQSRTRIHTPMHTARPRTRTRHTYMHNHAYINTTHIYQHCILTHTTNANTTRCTHMLTYTPHTAHSHTHTYTQTAWPCTHTRATFWFIGDDATKRAMMKSYQESGGTVLSTNWSEVGAGKVEIKPPEGMEYKKYEQ